MQVSVTQVNQLVSSIRSLQDNANCFGAEDLLDVATRFRSVHEDYLVYSDTRSQQSQTEKKVQLYSSMLASEELDTSQQDFIKQELFSSQTELIHIGAGLSRFDRMNNRYAQAANELTMAVDSFLQASLANPLCRESGLNFWSSMVGNGLMVASSFASPGASLALAAGSVLTGSITHYIRNIQYNRAYSRIDDFQFPLALRCVSEAMSQHYCETAETQKLIEDYQQGHNQPKGQSYQGIDLLTRQLNQLDHWLREILAGSAITSEGDLINRQAPITQFEFLQRIRRYLETYSGGRTRLFQEITNAQSRSDAIAIGITSLVSIMGHPSLRPLSFPISQPPSGVEHPIFLIRDISVLPYSLVYPNLAAVPRCDGEPCLSLADYVHEELGAQLTLIDWQRALSNAFAVVDDSLNRVSAERARTISVDAYSVFVRANRDFKGEKNAIHGLKSILRNADRIIEYLENLPCKGRVICYEPQIKNVQKTKELTQIVLDLVFEAFRPGSLDPESLPEVCQIDEAGNQGGNSTNNSSID